MRASGAPIHSDRCSTTTPPDESGDHVRGGRNMSEEETRAVVSRWFGALDAGDVDAAMACLADNVRWINSPGEEGEPGGIPGLSAIIPWLGDFSKKADVI